MKIAAEKAIAKLAHEEVSDGIVGVYHGNRLKFGPNYIYSSSI
ncbi:MAG: NADP-dependent malic enzyme [Bartonella clarridgeiae]|nr:MAG: NADP-dependent malic enzyme [Bartonella clarridgeiae]